MMFDMLVVIKDCSNPEELWHKINRYCKSMVADVGDKTYVTYSGRYEDAICIIEQCVFHGECEISISSRG